MSCGLDPAFYRIAREGATATNPRQIRFKRADRKESADFADQADVKNAPETPSPFSISNFQFTISNFQFSMPPSAVSPILKPVDTILPGRIY
jgi:hypothetical protein